MSRRSSRTVKGHKHGRVPRAFREEQLLDVAQALFARQGYQGTSIEDISAAAGVTRPMVYNYFNSKDGIYLACLRRARAQFERELTAAVAAAQGPYERLAAGTDAYFRFVETQGAAWDVLFGGGAAVAGPAAAEASRLRLITVGRIAGLLKENSLPRVTEDEVEAFANIISGAGEQLAKWWRDNPRIPRERLVGYQLSICWLGLERIVAGSRRQRSKP